MILNITFYGGETIIYYVKKCRKMKKTNEGNTFHEKYTDPDDSQRFFEKV